MRPLAATGAMGSRSAFEPAVIRSPEVRESRDLTGSAECLLRVEASDLEGCKVYDADVPGTLPRDSAITTYVVIHSPEDERA